MRRILIVDDENGVLEELSDYFVNDYEIVTARSSAEAIKLFEGVDIAIIDMYMETERSGIDVLKAAKKAIPFIQCIILTAYGTTSNAVEAMKAGAYDYVEKQAPNIYEALSHKMIRALEHKDSLEALRRSEEKYNELQQKIVQQERLRDMGQLASGVAHDFNNQLTPVLGYSDFILNDLAILDDKETTIHCLNMIRTAAEDAVETVNRLKKFYRKRDENESFLPVNINQLIEQIILLTQPRWKNQAQATGVTIDILTDLQDIPLINGKESELREVFTNLIFNSVDALSINGTITLSTQTDGEYVIIKVSDTGLGMTEEVRKRCFEPFFSTKDSTGMGLGLSVVYGIIQLHEGIIEVESKAGRGTTFTILLPIATEIKYKEEVPKVEAFLRPLHILVVDDESAIRDLLSKFLTRDGHFFEMASNGFEGLTKFRSGNFDLVITDKAMPDMGGDQLADLIKKIKPKVPIIMITGFGNVMEFAGVTPKNIDCLLSKPFTLDKLRRALIEIIAHSEE
jgi:signal transduction histidine kinase